MRVVMGARDCGVTQDVSYPTVQRIEGSSFKVEEKTLVYV